MNQYKSNEINDSLQKAFQLFENHKSESHLSGPKDDKLIEAAEKSLGVYFPPSYKEFVKRWVWGSYWF